MSRRSRRQTRTRLTTGYRPEWHNEDVAVRKAIRQASRSYPAALRAVHRAVLGMPAFFAPIDEATRFMIAREQRWQRRDRITDCITCMVADSMTPMHDPSPSCQSGSRPHCTCDTCY